MIEHGCLLISIHLRVCWKGGRKQSDRARFCLKKTIRSSRDAYLEGGRPD